MNATITALNNRQERFIVSRTQQEASINAWLRNLGNLPLDIYQKITEAVPITKDMTAKDLIPEWWEAVPNKEKATKQVLKTREYLSTVDKLILQYLEEGEEVHKQYEALAQGGN